MFSRGKNKKTLHFASKQQCRVLGILSMMSQGSLFHFVRMLCHIRVQSVFSAQKYRQRDMQCSLEQWDIEKAKCRCDFAVMFMLSRT